MEKKGLLLASLGVADLLGAIDSTALTVALPTITKDLHLSVAVSQWIPNAYTLVLVSTLILMGKVGDRIGAKRLYLWGLLLFGGCSLLLVFLQQPYVIIAIRALQGLGTAILYTMPFAIIGRLWGDRQEEAFAVTASMFAVGMMIGPVIGGLLSETQYLGLSGWHYIFLINVPLIAVGYLISLRAIPAIPKERNQEPLRLVGVAALILTLILLVLGLAWQRFDIFGAGLGTGLVFSLIEQKDPNPLFAFHLFKNPTFSAANGISFFMMLTIMAASFVLTFFLQDVLKFSPLETALAILPVPVVTVVFSLLGAKIHNWRVGGFLASALTALGLLFLMRVGEGVPYSTSVLPAVVLLGAGSGILMTVLFAAIIGSASKEHAGAASGLLNTIQQLAALMGVALVTPFVAEYQLAFLILAIIGVIGIVPAFWVKNASLTRQIKTSSIG